MTWLDNLCSAAHDRLLQSSEILDTLYLRGVDEGQVKDYQLGYVDKFPVEIPEAYRHKFKGLSNAVVFPLTNLAGTIGGVQCRSVDRVKKQYHTFYLDEVLPTGFGIGQSAYHMWSQGEVMVVEGPFDLFPVQRVVGSVIATLTAKMTQEVERMIRRMVKSLWVGYDRDEAGQKGAVNAQTRLQTQQLRVITIKWPVVKRQDGSICKDPGDLWETMGTHRFNNMLRDSIRDLDSFNSPFGIKPNFV